MIFQHALNESLAANADQIAIETEDGALSYRALAGAANMIAAFLTRKGAAGKIIGIATEDKIALITAMIGIANARCIFAPIDTAFPGERMSRLVVELDLSYVIVSDRQKANPAFTTVPNVLTLGEMAQAGEAGGPAYPTPAYDGEDSLYIYFTSGTTGTPKGIVGKNSSLLHFLQWEIDAFGFTARDRFSQFISPFFDAFLRDIFAPLLTGGVICLPPDDKAFFMPENLIPWINSRRITVIHCVPSVFRLFNQPTLVPSDYRELKYILLSGEKIIPAELGKWYSVFGRRIQLVNLYGATETTMIRTWHLIQPEDLTQPRIPVGKPIADTEVFIATRDLHPCDVLVPGELYILSKFMSKGYLNDREQTERKFVRISRDGRTSELAYRTGDIARFLKNGLIDLIEREDRQLKLRGIRVEPEEIEQTLMQSGLVSNAIVLQTGAEGNESLAAFVIRKSPAGEGAAFTEAVKGALERHLPSYMIPSAIIEVGDFPLLSNGKLDRRKLLELLNQEEITVPANDVERKLHEIWVEILNNKLVSTSVSFIKAGGNSLNMMRLTGRIYKAFNVRIKLNDLFNHLTIKEQGRLVRKLGRDNLLTIPKAEIKDGYALSATQERIFYEFMTNRDNTVFNMPMLWEVEGSADIPRIESTIQKLIERHESLRTAFIEKNGAPLQAVRPRADFTLQHITARSDEVTGVVRSFVRPFDLTAGNLIRGAIVSTDTGHLLLVDLHHIICDGMSQVILFSDFIRLYKGELLVPLERTYKDYAEWEANFRLTDEYLSCREFWLETFAEGVPGHGLPTKSPSPEKRSDNGGSIEFAIPRDSLRPFLEFLEKEEITLFSGLFSLFLLFLYEVTGRERNLVGIVSSGRFQQEMENVAGMFAKILPVCRGIDPDATLTQYIRDIHEFLIAAFSKQIYDLSNIISDLNQDKATALNDIIEAAFVLQNFGDGMRGNRGTDFKPVPLDSFTAKYPLTLIVEEWEGEILKFSFEYLFDYFTASDMEMIGRQFMNVLEKASGNLNGTIVEVLKDGGPRIEFVDEDISFSF